MTLIDQSDHVLRYFKTRGKYSIEKTAKRFKCSQGYMSKLLSGKLCKKLEDSCTSRIKTKTCKSQGD